MDAKGPYVRVLIFVPAEAHAQYYLLRAYSKQRLGRSITHRDVYLRGLHALFEDLGIDPASGLSLFRLGESHGEEKDSD